MAERRKPQTTEIEIVNYDTTYLDHVDGSVTDLATTPTKQEVVPYRRNNLVLPSTSNNNRRGGELSPKQAAVLGANQTMISGVLAMPTQMSSHARQDDNAIIVAHAHNIASRPKLLVAGAICLLVALAIGLFWQLGRGDFMLTAVLAGIVWGGVAIYILHRDRALALHHSAPGVEHHKIDAQTEVQKTAVQSWENIMLALIKSEGANHD